MKNVKFSNTPIIDEYTYLYNKAIDELYDGKPWKIIHRKLSNDVYLYLST